MLPRLSLGLTVAVLSTLVLGVPEVALAAPPPNDDFDNAKVIRSLPYTNRMNPRETTKAPDDPNCNGRDNTVWYSYRPTRGRWIRAETPGSTYNTTLSVYSGTRGNLTQLVCDNDAGKGPLVTVRLHPNVTYHFMIGAERAGELGRLVFSVKRAKPSCLNREATILGTDGSDTIVGTRKRDVIQALRGNDSIDGRGGRDIICGDAGDDSIVGRGFLEGEDGDDNITAIPETYKRSTINGGAGNDDLTGALGPDQIAGGEGADSLEGGPGRDYLLDDGIEVDQVFGGPGIDLIQVGKGNDLVDGGPGQDFLRYGEDVRALDANLTTGVVAFGAFTQTVLSIEGVRGTEVQDTLVGSPGSDELHGGGHVDTILGMGGDDFIFSGESGGTFNGGEGDDTIFIREGLTQVSGEDGNDVIDGGVGDDVIDGGLGEDFISGDLGVDTITGGDGGDFVRGQGGDDDLAGEAGDDVLQGSSGGDSLDGGDGFDWLDGGPNTDSCLTGEKLWRCET